MPFNELEVSKTLTIIKIHQDDGKWFFDSIINRASFHPTS